MSALLFLDVDRVHVEGLVAELVEAGEGDPQVGRLEQVLHLLAVGVEAGGVDVDGGRQHSVNHLNTHHPVMLGYQCYSLISKSLKP